MDRNEGWSCGGEAGQVIYLLGEKLTLPNSVSAFEPEHEQLEPERLVSRIEKSYFRIGLLSNSKVPSSSPSFTLNHHPSGNP
jgi:hypothetical protein